MLPPGSLSLSPLPPSFKPAKQLLLREPSKQLPKSPPAANVMKGPSKLPQAADVMKELSKLPAAADVIKGLPKLPPAADVTLQVLCYFPADMEVEVTSSLGCR